jgi:TolA-binding protein
MRGCLSTWPKALRFFHPVQFVAALICVVVAGQGGWAQEPQSSAAAVTAYADAANFQNNGEYGLAGEEWQKFLTKFPQDPLAIPAQHYLGVCLLQQKKTAAAAQAFAAVIAKNQPFDALDESLLNLGYCQHALGQQGDKTQYEAAIKTLVQFREKYPESKLGDQALFYLGESHYHLGALDDAIPQYAKLVEQYPQSPLQNDAVYAMGVALQERGRMDEAAQAFDRFLADSSDHALAPEVRMRKAETLIAANDFANAEKLFAAAASAKDFRAADRAMYRQAYCLVKLDQLPQAATLYGQLVNQYPKSPLAHDSAMAAGRTWYRTGNSDQAKHWFDQVFKGGGDDRPEAAHWLARLAIKEQKPKDAIAVVEQAIPLSANSDYAALLHIDLADALYEIPERRTEAMAKYRGVAEQFPDSTVAPQSLYNAAFAALELKQFDQATALAEAFGKQFAEHALRADAEYVLAESHLLQGNHAAAQASYARLLDSFSDNAMSSSWRVRLGLALFLQQKYAETIAQLQEIAGGLPAGATRAEAYYLIGASQSRMGNHAEAIASLQASLDADAKWTDADDVMLALASAQTQLGQTEAAQQTLAKMTEQFANSPLLGRSYYQQAELDFAAEKFEAAIASYERVLSQEPNSSLAPAAWYGKAWSHLRLNQLEPAEAALANVIDKFGAHELATKALRARAFCRQLQGNFPAALQDIAKFLETKPEGEERWDALYIQGLCQVGTKQFDQAIASFQAIADSGQAYSRLDRVFYELAWAWESAGDKDKASEAFAALVEKFPDSHLAGEAFYHVGESLYAKKDFVAASSAYESARTKAIKADVKEKATYKLGWTWYRQQDYEKAREAFQQQITEFGEGELATSGLFMVGECLFRQDKFEEALAAYRGLAGKTGLDDNAAGLALLHAGQSANQLKQWNVGLEYFAKLLADFPASPYRAQAQYEQGWAHQNLGQHAPAREAYQAVIESSRNALGARAQFMQGELYFADKDFTKALAEFQRLMYGYGGDRAPDDVKPWQAKGSLEAGRCAAVLAGQATDASAKQEHLARAVKYFQHVIQKHPSTDEAKAAAEQLKRIQ